MEKSDFSSEVRAFPTVRLISGAASGAKSLTFYLRKLGFQKSDPVEVFGYISPYSKMGWGCVLLNNSLIQNGATVGNGVLMNPGVEVHHDSSVEDYALIYTNSVVRTYAKVGKRVRIGSNVTVSNEVIVGDDADIQNGETLF